jgi:hypothetical protein
MPHTFGRVFDIGGPERLSYESLLRQYAQIRGLHRTIISVPLLSLRLSSLWLFFVTNTSFAVARALVDSLTHETVCRDNAITKVVPQVLLTYREAIEKAFGRIAQNRVPSSWFDALASGQLSPRLWKIFHVPEHGVLCDRRKQPLMRGREAALDAIWTAWRPSGVAFNELGLETEGRDRSAFRRNWPAARAPQSLSALLGRRLGFLESIAGGSHGGTFDPLCRDEAARRSVAGISGIRARARANRDFSAARSIRSSVLVPLPSLSRLALSADGTATRKIVELIPEMMNS